MFIYLYYFTSMLLILKYALPWLYRELTDRYTVSLPSYALSSKFVFWTVCHFKVKGSFIIFASNRFCHLLIAFVVAEYKRKIFLYFNYETRGNTFFLLILSKVHWNTVSYELAFSNQCWQITSEQYLNLNLWFLFELLRRTGFLQHSFRRPTSDRIITIYVEYA